MSGVGVISLAGVVVNNAIVLIDYVNKLRQRGMEIRDAVISAGATRLRPVLLTAITTVLGLLPMVTGVSYDFHKMSISLVSASTQWWQNMAIVVIFGLGWFQRFYGFPEKFLDTKYQETRPFFETKI